MSSKSNQIEVNKAIAVKIIDGLAGLRYENALMTLDLASDKLRKEMYKHIV